jgi:hypothetical protein
MMRFLLLSVLGSADGTGAGAAIEESVVAIRVVAPVEATTSCIIVLAASVVVSSAAVRTATSSGGEITV